MALTTEQRQSIEECLRLAREKLPAHERQVRMVELELQHAASPADAIAVLEQFDLWIRATLPTVVLAEIDWTIADLRRA